MAGKYRIFCFAGYPFSLKLAGTVFDEVSFVSSIFLSQVINKSSLILSARLPFSQLHVAGFHN